MSGLLDSTQSTNAANTPKENEDSLEGIPLCGILSIKFYRPYFDVDTKDIVSRLYSAVVSYKDNSFMSLIADKPDAYGPFWVINFYKFSKRFNIIFITILLDIDFTYIRTCSIISYK